MTSARLRFVIFVMLVLGLPGGLMALDDPRIGDLGKLALILTPALAGVALGGWRGLGGSRPSWSWVGLGALVTLAVAALALAAAFAVGVTAFRQPPAVSALLAQTVGAVALTSVLEELGWAGGGLTLAIAALGRRWGVAVLGLVWAAWHLIPVALKIGLFPELEAAPPAMLIAFVACCMVYRELLTRLRERAGTWLAAAAGHAAPNMALAAAMAGGLGAFDLTPGWWAFPAPGGLVFLALATLAVLGVGRLASGRREALG